MYNIEPDIILAAAKKKYGESVNVSPPYWVDHECVRIGVCYNGGISHGANFYYKEGVIR